MIPHRAESPTNHLLHFWGKRKCAIMIMFRTTFLDTSTTWLVRCSELPIVLINLGSFDRGSADGHSFKNVLILSLISFTCRELRLADTFKTFTDSTGKSFLSIRGMLFLSRHKLHPNSWRKRTWGTIRTGRASPRLRQRPQEWSGWEEGLVGGLSWWPTGWKRKNSSGCRSENGSLRPLYSSPAAPLTFSPSLGQGHSLAGSQTPTRTPGLQSENG